MIRKYTVVLGLCLPGSIAFGAKPDHVSPVDRDGNLQRVGEVFSLPDGPAWDGSAIEVGAKAIGFGGGVLVGISANGMISVSES